VSWRSLLLFLSDFLGILTVLAVLALLHFELDFPRGRNWHEPVLEPDKVFSEAPVRGQKQNAWSIIFCLWNLPSYLVLVDVPNRLASDRQLLQPVAAHLANIFFLVFQLADVLGQRLVLPELRWL